jgi:transposase
MTEVYAALDVSDKTTHICVVDKEGSIVWRGVCATDPEALATVLEFKGHDTDLSARVGIKS